jgi:thioesterase domain-containing protein/acyl carrier protein
VAIRETGSAPPLFLVHGAPGEVSWAVDLAGRLGDDIPVYAFEAPGLHGDRPVPERVEDFAVLYADLLERACATGPYHLGGYSGGGAIAFETARILAGRGRPAAGLILLDANAPGTDSLKGMDAAFGDGFIHRLAANWLGSRWGGTAMLDPEVLDEVPEERRTDLALDHLFTTSTPPMAREELRALIDGMDAVAGGIGRALAAYEAEPIAPALPTLLIRCERGMAPEDNPLGLPAFLTDGDYRAGWEALVGAKMETVAVDCDHFSLVLQTHVDRVAEAIRATLLPAPKANGRNQVAAVVLEKVRSGLADVPPEEIVPERSMTDLGATSLDRVEVTLAAMEALGLDIPPRDLVGLANIDALIDVLHRHLEPMGPGE